VPVDRDEVKGRGFLLRILDEGASRLGVAVAGKPVFGWRGRTIGACAARDGELFWLRATGELRKWAGGPAWTGSRDANALTGIPRPEFLGQTEWTEGDVEIYAQFMTLAPGASCSPSPEAREEISLPDTWWTALAGALSRLAVADSRGRLEPAPDEVGAEPDPPFVGWTQPADIEITTAHRDLHWANLMAPELCIVDWELWGPAEAGLDAATLYCHSLLVPPVAAKVHEVFADTLESPSGRLAQLSVITHLLRRADGGDYPDLVPPLKRLAARLADCAPPGAARVH
jgi:hypothetical protein